LVHDQKQHQAETKYETLKGCPPVSEKRGPEVTVSRSPHLICTPAHRGRWKRTEADNENGSYR